MCNVLVDLPNPSIINVVTKGMKSWSELTEFQICRSWIMSGVIPRAVRDTFNASYGRTKNISKQIDVEEILRMLRRLSFSIGRRNAFYEQVKLTVTVGNMKLILEIGDSADI